MLKLAYMIYGAGALMWGGSCLLSITVLVHALRPMAIAMVNGNVPWTSSLIGLVWTGAVTVGHVSPLLIRWVWGVSKPGALCLGVVGITSLTFLGVLEATADASVVTSQLLVPSFGAMPWIAWTAVKLITAAVVAGIAGLHPGQSFNAV